MEPGRTEIKTEDKAVIRIVNDITGESPDGLFRVCEKYGENDDDIRFYDVYKVYLGSRPFILKKTGRPEADNYERYLAGRGFNVPAYIGKHISGSGTYILTEYIDGEDLRDMTDEKALSAAATLASYQNAFRISGGNRDFDRYKRYTERIRRRADSIKSDKLLSDAYSLFLERQETCPLTLSHGDFLQFNLIWHNDAAYAVDWGFGGIMPYSLDIARFIAHATENRDTFPFYMNKSQKRLFTDGVYRLLSDDKPSYEQYISDVGLALLNEYVEFIEANEDDNGWYYEHAAALSAAVLEGSECDLTTIIFTEE